MSVVPVALVGCATGAAEAPFPPVETTDISWGECTGKDAPGDPFECATVAVPLDHRRTDADTIPVALVRIPATETPSRGVILTNPGGPGSSGFDFVVNAGERLVSAYALESFDLIGFDPRGVSRSGGLRCQTDEEMDKFAYVDSTPDTPAEQELYDASGDAFAAACTAKYGDSLTMYSTEYTARDMDLIRASMGEETINYLGISYGTYLGGVYATLFPERVESMILDGPFDPQGDTVEQQYTTQAKGFEDAFNNWVAWCEDDDTCPFWSADVAARFDRLLENLDDEPLKAADGREINNAVMTTATSASMYARASWPDLAGALAAAERGSGERLLRIADRYNERNDDGTYGTLFQAFPVIQCASGFGSPAVNDAAALVATLKEMAPRYARNVEESDFDTRECDGLMDDPDMIEISYRGDAPVLVIGGANDPATPFRWAEEMAANMGDSARLVRFTGEGHSQILASKCVDEIVKRFLSEERSLPVDGAECNPDEPVARPDWWSQIPSLDNGATVVNRAEMDAYTGLKDSDAWAEYRAAPRDAGGAFVDISLRLKKAGFSAENPDATSAEDAPQWFRAPDSSGYLGVLVFSADQIKKDGFVQPDGPVPAGNCVVMLYYWP